jgi:hypothetical protein
LAQNQGKPGGRLLELLLAFVLVVVSGVLLVAGCALVLAGFWALFTAAMRIGPGLMLAVSLSSGWVITRFGRPVMRVVWAGLRAIWKPYLAYYRLEAHTLRPIKYETIAKPDVGSDKNEG